MKRQLIYSAVLHGALGALIVVSVSGEHGHGDHRRERVEFSVDERAAQDKAPEAAPAAGGKTIAAGVSKRKAAAQSSKRDPGRPAAGKNGAPDGPGIAGAPAPEAGGGVAAAAAAGGEGAGAGGSSAGGRGGAAGAGTGGLQIGTGGGAAAADIYGAIRDAIEREAKNSYPIKARRLRMQGVVTASFSVGEGGRPAGIEIISGSGHAVLDAAAAGIIERAGPYPPVPERITIPIRFELER